jgi:RNA polymerase sigma factor (TIGR02999 family)
MPFAVSSVTQILASIQAGNAGAADQLMALVYDELRRMASFKMAQEAPGNTLQPTALVHEAWLRLTGGANLKFEGRAHFFVAAAEAMRRILIEAARRRSRLKRGGEWERTELLDNDLVQQAPSEEMLAIDEALDLLAATDAEAANLVKLRYFTGMSMEEAAAALNLPLRSAERLWTFARAWLRRKIEADLE